jgi:hypothetical protein
MRAGKLVPVLLLLAVPASAAPHGKPGLWTVVTTMQMPNMPQLPPQVAQQMKQRGLPDMTRPMTQQICMTDAQAKALGQPKLERAGTKCTTRIVSQSGNAAVSEAICHGRMEGTVRTEISWRGEAHYEDNTSFKGKISGRPQTFSSRQSGDWVKADCGAVKPFDSKRPAAARP